MEQMLHTDARNVCTSNDEFYTPTASPHKHDEAQDNDNKDENPDSESQGKLVDAADGPDLTDIDSPPPPETKSDPWSTMDNLTQLGLGLGPSDTISKASTVIHRFSLESQDDGPAQPAAATPASSHPAPFNRWIKTLHDRAAGRRLTVSDTGYLSAPEDDPESSNNEQRRYRHKKSSSASSIGFITAVKSASISLASFSVARSRRTVVSSRQIRGERSASKTSNYGHRLSEDSAYMLRGSVVIDEAVTERSFKRRRVLEELINTEESYVADIRFLMNVYVTLLASIPTICPSLRTSIKRNLTEIVELHEELLGDLHRAVPHSEYTQGLNILKPTGEAPTRGHHRWKSLDASTDLSGYVSQLTKAPGVVAEPKIAAEVAKVFAKKMYRFFAYEEYGAKYEAMVKDVASTYRTIPQWDTYQKGLETLAAAMMSINSQQGNTKKSLTVGDLLVKPIQRVCRYPLLFAELLKQTPVCDCPDSHLEIEKVLARLRETTGEINRATDDPRMKSIMEKTWLLQDRLRFPDKLDTASSDAVRTLGHVHLCGVLYVAWQTKDGVKGQYMICLLYGEYLLLADIERISSIYKIQAGIGLGGVTIDDVDTGRGLQCHTAPFSWKLIFESDHQLYEIIMSACSPKEELEWRSRLTERASKEPLDPCEQALITTLSLDIRAMGTVFGKPGTVARRLSIHRATTLGPKSALCQVIIKNTSSMKDTAPVSSNNAIIRSQSLLCTNRIPVLAPSRVDRVKLEAFVSDVWTRDILPFPGMSGRTRSEHIVRSSASSMMRKLSVASITSGFTKRSGSLASLKKVTDDAKEGEEEELPSAYEEIAMDGSISSGLSTPPEPQEMALMPPSLYSEPLPEDSTSEMLSRGSPIGTMKRKATLRTARSWHPVPFQRRITPPLRTSSANSLQARPCSQGHNNKGTFAQSEKSQHVWEGAENRKRQYGVRKKRSIIGGLNLNRGFSTETFKSFFR